MAGTTFEQWMERGRQSYALKRPDEAAAALARAFALATSENHFFLIAGTHRRFGRFELAIRALRQVLARNPDSVGAYAALASMVDFDEVDDDVRAIMRLYESARTDEDRISLGFVLGKAFQNMGQVDASFAYYEQANALRRKSIVFSIDDVVAHFAELKSTFTPEFFARHTGEGSSAESPIFIVGMPRSGSSLVEQILASHPAVFGGGEMSLMGSVEATMYDRSKGSLSAFLASRPTLAPWVAGYLEPIKAAMGDKRRFTDKNLTNFRRIGLIRLLFPRARIIHCVRDPLDNLFAIFRQSFGGTTFDYSYDQTDLAAYYRLYRDLMEHWDRTLPGLIYANSYESLVAQPEARMRALLDYCDLDWDPRCLEFYKTERGVPTLSVTQVRRPVYEDSVGIADAYRKHLGPLAAAAEALPLQPAAAGLSSLS